MADVDYKTFLDTMKYCDKCRFAMTCSTYCKEALWIRNKYHRQMAMYKLVGDILCSSTD